MRIIAGWQYKYIEKSLYNYNQLKCSCLQTERQMVKAIDEALKFFKDAPHETMMKQFYFEADKYRKKWTNGRHYQWVCTELLHTEEPNGYVIRREVVYRIAMNCYSLGLFQI